MYGYLGMDMGMARRRHGLMGRGWIGSAPTASSSGRRRIIETYYPVVLVEHWRVRVVVTVRPVLVAVIVVVVSVLQLETPRMWRTGGDVVLGRLQLAQQNAVCSAAGSW